MANLSVDTLEAVFNSAECKLNVIISKLEECFHHFEKTESLKNDDDNGNDESGVKLNPVTIIDTLKQIKSDLIHIEQMYGQLSDDRDVMQKELMDKYTIIAKEVENAQKYISN